MTTTTLICIEPNSEENDGDFDEFTIPFSEIGDCDVPSVATSHTVLKIQVDRNRLIEESSYFRGLLLGSFSESGLGSVSIRWNLESFLGVLKFIYGCQLDVTSGNFISLHETALFFGVETLLLNCRVWLEEITVFRGLEPPQLCLDSLIHIWNYGSENVHDFILHQCTCYLARNFMWAQSCNSFSCVPDQLLSSCLKHPDLTVDSEKHLYDAILFWLTTETANSKCLKNNVGCSMLRPSLLPLWFTTGKRICPFGAMFADKATARILHLTRQPSNSFADILCEGDLSNSKIRLTKFTQKVYLCGCPQITLGLFLISVLPSHCAESILKKIFKKPHINHVILDLNGSLISNPLDQLLMFEAVQEVDISNCPSLSLESSSIYFGKSFPRVRTLKAAYFLNFSTMKLFHFVQKFPLLTCIDLTLDINPIIPAKVAIISSSQILTPKRSMSLEARDHYFSATLSTTPHISSSNITKLTLEGRTDFNDSDLHTISQLCQSLNYVNFRGCTSVTDCGLSLMIQKCKRLHSVLVCGTSFGLNSVQALCLDISSKTQQTVKHPQLMVHRLQTLHIGGCNGVNGMILSEVMAGANFLTSLCLREIQFVDNALFRFQGSSLQMLDVSDTKVTCDALSHVIFRNSDLKCLKTRGCTHLLQKQHETERKLQVPSSIPNVFSYLGNSCQLEEIEFGWGFSFFSLESLKPAIRTLRTITVGLGGSLGHNGLELLPTLCPLLVTLILYFQVISDSAVISLLKTLHHLQFLALCYCFGEITSLSFTLSMPNLMKLKLERVTPWMTNEDLVTLADCCPKLIMVSLIGCLLLSSESQDIISNRWPGLTSLHLEDCGEITANGVRSLFDLHALEDLILRHTGAGIPRNFIIHAASMWPMLRKISVDICDAREGDFDIPSFDDRYFLSFVKIARCKLQKCSIDLHGLEARRNPVHKETLVLVWNSQTLVRTVVKERL